MGANESSRTLLPTGIHTTFYVNAVDGDDAADGLSEATAWQSIDRVQVALDEGVGAGTAFLFAAGQEFHGWLRLTHANSGNADVPVVLGAFGAGAAPRLVGSAVIDGASFGPSGAAYIARWPYAVERLFVDGREVFMARFPNAHDDPAQAVIRTVAGTNSTVTVNTADLDGHDVVGAYAWVRTHSWRRDRVLVDSATVDGDTTTLVLSKYCEPGCLSAGLPNRTLSIPALPGAGVFFEGKLDFLDAPGEWYSDGSTLHLIAPADVELASAIIEVTPNTSVIEAGARGATGDVTHLVVQDLIIERGGGAGIRVVSLGEGPVVRNCTIRQSHYAGIDVIGFSTPTLLGNTISGARNWGITVSDGTDAIIRDNDVGSGGGGPYATYGVGIATTWTSNALIEHNYVHDYGHSAIAMGLSQSTTVRFNVMTRAPNYFGDSGAVYWNYEDGGQLIDRNILCDGSSDVRDAVPNAVDAVHGIYADDDVRPTRVEGNTIIAAGVCGISFVSQGTDVDKVGGEEVPSHLITNNVLVGNGGQEGQGRDGAQVCFQHAKERTGGLDEETLGQLRGMSGNVFYAAARWQRALRLTSYDAVHDFGAIDHNTYVNPFSPIVVRLGSDLSAAGDHSLPSWQTLSGDDLASSKPPLRRTECEVTQMVGDELFSASMPWSDGVNVGNTGILLRAPTDIETQHWIANATPIATTPDHLYLLTLTGQAPVPVMVGLYHGGASRPWDAANNAIQMYGDPSGLAQRWVFRASSTGVTLQFVNGTHERPLTLNDISVHEVTGACDEYAWNRVRVVSNPTLELADIDIGAGPWVDLAGNPIGPRIRLEPFTSVVVERP